MAHDGSTSTAIHSREMEVMLQRRGGLHISSVAPSYDILEAAGEVVDRLGDGLANAGEFNRRHNRVVNAVHTMVKAVGVGPCECVRGDMS